MTIRVAPRGLGRLIRDGEWTAPAPLRPRPERVVLVAGALVAMAATFALQTVLVAVRPLDALLTAAIAGAAGLFMFDTVLLRRENRTLRHRLVDSVDQERDRLRRELHDSAQQRLVSARIRTGMLASQVDAEPVRTTVTLLAADLDAAMADIRAVTSGGSADTLAAIGLAAALRNVAATAPLRIEVDAENLGTLPARVEASVYFCCLEAVQNIVKHAGATAQARIDLRRVGDRLVLEVGDSGAGFDSAAIRDGQGLRNIADRIRDLDGRILIESRPGTGTLIHAEIPIS